MNEGDIYNGSTKSSKRNSPISTDLISENTIQTVSEIVEEKRKPKRRKKHHKQKDPYQSEDEDCRKKKNHHKKPKKRLTRSRSASNSSSSLPNELNSEELKNLQNGRSNYDEVPDVLPSSIVRPSQPSKKVYIEKSSGGGFTNVSSKKLATISQYNSVTTAIEKKIPDSYKTPLDLGIETQRIFRSIGIFCHGFLAGISFWQLIAVFILLKENEARNFIEIYSPLSQPLQVIFYLLTVICVVSVLDRYDVSRLEWRQIRSMFTFKSGGLAIIVYLIALITTLATGKLDDKLSLYGRNSTLFEDPEKMKNDVGAWITLNLCRSVVGILGWIIISFKPHTDLLLKHLKWLSPLEDKTNS